MTDKCPFVPAYDGYAAQDGLSIEETMLKGGAPRQRADVIGAWALVNVQWKLKPFRYEVLRAFFVTVSQGGAVPFLIDLKLDQATLAEYTARFKAGTFKLDGINGDAHFCSAQLWVEPQIDDDYNENLVSAYYAFGDDAQSLMDQLDIIVNDDLPEAVPGS